MKLYEVSFTGNSFEVICRVFVEVGEQTDDKGSEEVAESDFGGLDGIVVFPSMMPYFSVSQRV